MPDYYALLKIDRAATQDEIKRAYRRRAREMHPDVNPDPETQELFKEVTQAYEVLSDVDKRRMYDMGQLSFQEVSSQPPAPGGVTREFNLAAIKRVIEMTGSATEALDFAIRTNEMGLAQKLIELDTVPAEKTLNLAVTLKSLKKVNMLIAAGAKPTPEMLHHAMVCLRMDIADALIAAGAAPLRKTRRFVRGKGWEEWRTKLADAHAKNAPPKRGFPLFGSRRQPAP